VYFFPVRAKGGDSTQEKKQKHVRLYDGKNPAILSADILIDNQSSQ
jgi:hypothetical protein